MRLQIERSWEMKMRKIVAAALVAAISALGTMGPGAVSADSERAITVMTQNLYQGTELEHVVAAKTQQQLLLGVATDYGNVIATNFPERAAAMANEIARDQPTLIGLQEVALWRAQRPLNPTVLPTARSAR